MRFFVAAKTLVIGLVVLWSILLIIVAHHALVVVKPSANAASIFATRMEDFVDITKNDNKSIKSSSQERPYKEDVLCRACRHAVADPRQHESESERCGVYIRQELNGRQLPEDITAAGVAVARRFPEGCHACEPSRPNCDKRFWRYDAAAPELVQSSSEMWLTRTNRLPEIAVDNVTKYFLDDKHVFPAAEYFMEYNPSIVIMPTNQRDLLNLDERTDYYLASFRVSNQHYCFQPKDRKRMAGGTATEKSETNCPGLPWLGRAQCRFANCFRCNSRFETSWISGSSGLSLVCSAQSNLYQ